MPINPEGDPREPSSEVPTEAPASDSQPSEASAFDDGGTGTHELDDSDSSAEDETLGSDSMDENAEHGSNTEEEMALAEEASATDTAEGKGTQGADEVAAASPASTSQIRTWWSPACKASGTRTTVPLHGKGRVTVDKRIVPAVRALNACLIAHKYSTRKPDTGAYNCRRITGGSGWSLHAYGIALDINWTSNPYGRTLVTDMPRAMSTAIKGIRTNNGKKVWGWGGDYRRNKDAMHFEIVCRPADLATGIRASTVPGGGKDPPAPRPPPPTPGNPAFPLPSGHWFGPESDNERNHSGYAAADRPGVAAIRKRLQKLGLGVPNGNRYNTALATVVKQFQRGKGIDADGLVGRQTWNALW